MIMILAIALIMTIVGLILGLLLKGIDRKIAAYFQSRIGPPLLQPVYDIIKLMYKQTIIPVTAVRWLFSSAPVIALASSALLLLYITIPYIFYIFEINTTLQGDLIVVLYCILIPSIAMVTGAFSSGSPYAAIGAQREMVILMSIELPIAVVIISVAWHAADSMADPFAISSLFEYPLWHNSGAFGVLGGILLFFAMVLVLPAEMSRVPFDQAEAETELAEGISVEYSGKLLAFILLTDAFKALALSMLVVILFFPYTLSQLFGISFQMYGHTLTPFVEIVFLLFKIIVIYSFGITFIRVVMARLKISQVARFFLFAITAISIIGLILIMLDPNMRII